MTYIYPVHLITPGHPEYPNNPKTDQSFVTTAPTPGIFSVFFFFRTYFQQFPGDSQMIKLQQFSIAVCYVTLPCTAIFPLQIPAISQVCEGEGCGGGGGGGLSRHLDKGLRLFRSHDASRFNGLILLFSMYLYISSL